MTAILTAFMIGAIWGLVTGLRLKHRRFLTVREQLRDATQRISAWKLADTKGDLDVVGPVTGQSKTVELFDGAQLAEWREQAERPRDIYSPDSVAHLGQACGWSDDGTTLCGEPAEGWARWPDDEPVWLCGVHGEWMRERPSTDGRRVD